MAKLFIKLRASLTSSEDRPIVVVTEQKFNEYLSIVRGKNKGLPIWCYILAPVGKVTELTPEQAHMPSSITKFGRVIKYRDNQGEIKTLSGWGTDPPKMLQTWIKQQYVPATIDVNINLKYEKDDIRLCTMQRAFPEQKLGCFGHYHRHECFVFFKFHNDSESSLAFRAGIKKFDRLIALNGVNVENDTSEQLVERFNVQRHLPVQMLVCSPATYVHYKSKKKLIHSGLPTVQHLKPVYATIASDLNIDVPIISFNDESFCAIQWENNGIISTVSRSTVFKSPELIQVNDICFVDVKGRYKRGKILFKGSYDDCKKFNTHLFPLITTKLFNTLNHIFIDKKKQNVLNLTTTHNFDFTDCNSISPLDLTTILSTKTSSQIVMKNEVDIQMIVQNNNDTINIKQNNEDIYTRLEQLPNELFFYLFTFINIQHLYNAFWGLNIRLNNLLQSCLNLSLTFNDKIDPLLMKSYIPYTSRLIIDTSNHCDFNQFSNLNTLILCNGNSKHLEQIHPEIIPKLTYLSFLLGSKFIPPSELVNDIFSDKFPSLYHVNLGCINELTTCSWSISSSLHFVSIRSKTPMIISSILASCPNLDHLQLHILDKPVCMHLSSSTNHPLRRLTLWSDSIELNFNDIDILLSYTPNVQYLYLQTLYKMSFIDLVNNLVKRLFHLSRFNCFIIEMMEKNIRIGDLNIIHQIHSCFNRIQCTDENETFRIFATE